MAGFRTARRIAPWTLALLCAHVPASALDPSKELTQYRLETWGVKEGLPAQTVKDIEQTRDGYIWIATQSLLRFDGVTFTVIDSAGDETLPTISALAASRDGSLWVNGRSAGVFRYRDGAANAPAPALKFIRSPAILEAREGGLWTTGREGLARFRDGHVELQLPDRSEVRAFAEMADGTIYAGLWDASTGALIQIKDDQVRYLDLADGLPDRHITALCATRDGALWVGTRNGLSLFRDGRFRTYGPREGLLHAAVSALLEDRHGNLWIGTGGGGLYRFQSGKITVLRKRDGLIDDSISALFEDDEGGLWVGGRGSLGRLRDTSVTMFTASEGLAVDAINATFPARGGGVWVASYGGGVSLFKDGRFETFGRETGLDDLSVGAVYEARDRTLWLGVGSNALFALRNGRARRIDTDGRYVLALGEDDRGLLVALREAGLFRLENDRVVPYRTPAGDEVKDKYIRALLIARNGTLWIGAAGISYVEGGRLVQPEEYRFSRNIYSLHEDAEGAIWAAGGAGLVRVKNGRVTRYEDQPYLWKTVLATVLEDTSGNLWINSEKGIVRAAKAELDDVADGRRTHATVRLFGPQDGLSLEEIKAPTAQRASRTADGLLWFPTPLGLARIDPEHLVRDTKAPPVRIERLAIDGRIAAARDDLELPAGTEKLEIHFSALSYTLSERATFRYWLEGFDPGWVDGGTSRVAHYTKLPPGSYRFRVRAANSEGVWNEEGAALRFSQRPRLHQTLRFRFAVTAALVLAVFSIHRLRIRQLKARERELSEKVQEALAQVKVLRGLMPICANCRKVRTDEGAYVNIEAYLQEHSYAELSHGICPECMVLLYPDYVRANVPGHSE